MRNDAKLAPMAAQGYFESNAAFEARAKEYAAKKAEIEARELEEAVRNGTAGRVVNDPEEQKRVVKYRQERKLAEEAARKEVELLNERRQLAHRHARQQKVDGDPIRGLREDAAPTALSDRLTSGDRNPAPKPIAPKMSVISTYAKRNGLIWKKPESKEKHVDPVAAAPSFRK